MTDDKDYPGIRHALESDATINLYCGMKWMVWQLFHLMIGMIGVGIGVIVIPFFLILSAILWIRALSMEYIVHPIVSPISERYRKLRPKSKSPTSSPQKRKSLFRYVYGHCPVDVKRDTRWFERSVEFFSPKVKRLEEVVSPPSKVSYCTECGEIGDGVLSSLDECLHCHGKHCVESDWWFNLPDYVER